ncbi:phage major capsid protein [Staphylococcus saprophyticus]|uniref:phage major capsid protein n=1 Tax=Staphylococcus saprophyticus TaxID=29385 RepID=UPI0006590315|nr:phage major capsid protein [Staphylococcus saprophyticus]CRV14329.1 phage protein [Streptococcus equi subsp. equi]MDW3949160.1 phage major capsid protein [Staphylococcus saprophyticus]MDW3991829.1 phage major capsid protein [Staphylococcus saprophyticus]MDW4083680.1 phage major capsid protein [Staphylococcus saprophyticus]MDW4090443.1 phage major capsid protein [Staphylococcus saprophyticus]
MATLQEQAKSINDLIDQAQKAVNNGDVETARKLKEEIQQAKDTYNEQKEIVDSVSAEEKISGDSEAPKEKTETEAKNEKPEAETVPEKDTEAKPDVDKEPKADEKEQPEEKPETPVEEKTPEELEEEKKKKLGGKRSMARQILENKENQLSDEVKGFVEYLKSKGAKRDNVKSVDAQPIIPEDIKYQPEELPETFVDLKKFVNVQPVTTAAGSHPILNPAQETMVSVEELEKNPELAKPKFTDIDYKVKTYRGQIPVSQESLDDSEANLANIVAQNNARQAVNTTNKYIADVMKSFEAVNTANLDDIKEIINVEIDPAYNLSLVVSQSFYQALDTLKDKNEQYLLKQDITSPTGTVLFGRPVFIIKDELFGNKGDKKAFIGDLKYAVFFADRKQASVKWVENEIYGQVLAAYMRFDVKKGVEEAGRFLTYTGTAGDLGTGSEPQA